MSYLLPVNTHDQSRCALYLTQRVSGRKLSLNLKPRDNSIALLGVHGWTHHQYADFNSTWTLALYNNNSQQYKWALLMACSAMWIPFITQCSKHSTPAIMNRAAGWERGTNRRIYWTGWKLLLYSLYQSNVVDKIAIVRGRYNRDSTHTSYTWSIEHFPTPQLQQDQFAGGDTIPTQTTYCYQMHTR